MPSIRHTGAPRHRWLYPVALHMGISNECVYRGQENQQPLERIPAYCGIYCVYGALQALGIECDFRDL